MDKEKFLEFHREHGLRVAKLQIILYGMAEHKNLDSFTQNYLHCAIGYGLSLYSTFHTRFFTSNHPELAELSTKELIEVDYQQREIAAKLNLLPGDFLPLINEDTAQFQTFIMENNSTGPGNFFFQAALMKAFEASNQFDLLYRSIFGGVEEEIRKDKDASDS